MTSSESFHMIPLTYFQMSINYQDLTLALQIYTVVLCLIGLFGNINLIVATCRHKSLRTKMGEFSLFYSVSEDEKRDRRSKISISTS